MKANNEEALKEINIAGKKMISRKKKCIVYKDLSLVHVAVIFQFVNLHWQLITILSEQFELVPRF